ncbi:hypothetical protein GPX89_04020 [Nocardia sp. ET3-3]|uniref:Uncharacterized protein n=1 Tax=Nocardia terrae TaxID=2675851 RepID=A0A7K1UPZ5_9NOCA|nr:hypothetical protein [Nocardia terrae]MVU76410.1 hypothetical protein [Nocardia terrae]
MQQAHRSRPTLRRLGLLLTPLAGAAAAIVAAGPATAESLSSGTSSADSNSAATLSGGGLTGNGPSGGTPGTRSGGGIITHGDDPTGLHASDPFGYYHSDMNPVLQNQHPRQSEDPAQPDPQPLSTRAGNPAAWTPSWNDDGTGYTVCRPLATYC